MVEAFEVLTPAIPLPSWTCSRGTPPPRNTEEDSGASQAWATLTAIPNIEDLSACGQTIVRYPGCRLAKLAKPACIEMSSTSMTPPGDILDAACSISNTVFLVVCRLSWTNTCTWPSSATSDGSRCRLEPSRYDHRSRKAS